MAGGISLPQPDPTNNMEVWTHASAKLSARTLDWTKNIAELSVGHKKQTTAVSKAVAATQEGDPSLSSIDAKLDSGNKQAIKFHKEDKVDKIHADEKMFKNLREWTSSAFSKVGSAITHDTTGGINQIKKGWNELFNGLGELGPLVSMTKDIFHKIRGVFDILIGGFRAVWGGLKWVFGKIFSSETGDKIVNTLNYKEENGDSSDDSDRPEGETDVKPIPLPVLVAGYTDKAEAYQKAFDLEEQKRHNELILLDARGNKIEKEQLKQEKEQTKVQKKIHKRQWLTALMMFAKWGLILAGILAIWNWLKSWWNPDGTKPTAQELNQAAIVRGVAKLVDDGKTKNKNIRTPAGGPFVGPPKPNINLTVDKNNPYRSPIVGQDGQSIKMDRYKWDPRLGTKPVGWDTMSPEVQRATFNRHKQAAEALEIKNRTSASAKWRRAVGGTLNAAALYLVADASYDEWAANTSTTDIIKWHWENDLPVDIMGEDGQMQSIVITDEMMEHINEHAAAINLGDWTGILTGLGVGGSAWAAAARQQWKDTGTLLKNYVYDPKKGFVQNLTGFKSGDGIWGNTKNLVAKNWFTKKITKAPELFYYVGRTARNVAAPVLITTTTHGVVDETTTRGISALQGHGWMNPSDDFLHYFADSGKASAWLDNALGTHNFNWRSALDDDAWRNLVANHILPAVAADEELNKHYQALKTDEERLDFYNQIIPIMMDHSANVDQTVFIQDIKDKYRGMTLETVTDGE